MKFQNWLIKKGFNIISEYNNITNSIIFYKDNLKFEFRLAWYNGNKVDCWTILHNKNNKILLKSDSIISACNTQKELIEKFEKYCIKNNLI